MGTVGRDPLALWPGESDIAWETRLSATADYAAALLLETCSRLGWGCGVAIPDAHSRLGQVGRDLGYPDWDDRPRTPQRKSLSPGISRRVWDRDGWECRHCGSHRDLTVDHITPVAAGGTDDFDNLQTLCKSCNSSKGARV